MYTNTVPICYVILRDEDRCLLVQKQYPSMKSHTWNFLREEIAMGESVLEAATRIAKEKVGLDIQLTGVNKVLYQTLPSTKPETIHIAFSFFATAFQIPTHLSLGDDIVSTRWVTKDELASIYTTKEFGGPQSRYIATCVLKGENYP